ncbi:hypothetical protein WJX74_004049 [Apatococcus lobatus]|uniref:Uncharacterized protein n=1 Tax=Apatococcus lobatus TaxID=904363 RepID=A0AAW1RZJ9_9CHLO
MDLPSKATARSKWRSSQSHKPGQPHRPAGSLPSKTLKAGLESNLDRYEEEEVDTRPGQMRQSQGEDLAALLRDADGLHQAARHRTRQSADPQVELLESAMQGQEPQGLTLDLEALAQALSLIPLHEVLGLDPKFFPDEPPQTAISTASTAKQDGMNAAPSTASADDASSSTCLSTASFATGTSPAAKSAGPSAPGMATVGKQTSLRHKTLPSTSQPAAPSAFDLQVTGSGSSQPVTVQGEAGSVSNSNMHLSNRRGRHVTPAESAVRPEQSRPNSDVQQTNAHKSLATPTSGNFDSHSQLPVSSASASSAYSSAANSNQLQQQPTLMVDTAGNNNPAQQPGTPLSDVKTGSLKTGAAQHAASGLSSSDSGLQRNSSAAVKPSAASVAAEDDDELDALLNMSGAAGPKAAQKSSGKHGAHHDEDDLGALLGLSGDENIKRTKPQQSSNGPTHARQQPDDDSLESFLDSL